MSPSTIDYLNQQEAESKLDSAIELLKKEGKINANMVITELNCNVKTANKIINMLFAKGYITPM